MRADTGLDDPALLPTQLRLDVSVQVVDRSLDAFVPVTIFVQARNRDKLEKLFNSWLMEQAREYMATQTIKYARELGVQRKLKDVVFRKTRTKWGHCCQDGTIQYNWLAMMAPREVVNYLIAHETSHLRHLDHSPRFWATVESLCPDYKELRSWLTDNGHRFWTVAPH